MIPADGLAAKKLTFNSAGAVVIREDSATAIAGTNTALSLDLDSTGAITDAEEALARRYFEEEIGGDEFVREIDDPAGKDRLLEGTHTGAGGTINAYVKLEGPTLEILQRALITGDFFITPPRVIFDLESRLRGVYLEDLDSVITDFFEDAGVDVLSVAPGDFVASIRDALDRA